MNVVGLRLSQFSIRLKPMIYEAPHSSCLYIVYSIRRGLIYRDNGVGSSDLLCPTYTALCCNEECLKPSYRREFIKQKIPKNHLECLSPKHA